MPVKRTVVEASRCGQFCSKYESRDLKIKPLRIPIDLLFVACFQTGSVRKVGAKVGLIPVFA